MSDEEIDVLMKQHDEAEAAHAAALEAGDRGAARVAWLRMMRLPPIPIAELKRRLAADAEAHEQRLATMEHEIAELRRIVSTLLPGALPERPASV